MLYSRTKTRKSKISKCKQPQRAPMAVSTASKLLSMGCSRNSTILFLL